MNKMKGWIVGLTLVALLGVGIAAIAGNRFGQGAGRSARSGETASATCNGDCAQAQDGTGNSTCDGYGQNQSEARPLDGTGYHGGRSAGLRNGQRAGQAACAAERGSCAGTCSK